MRQNLMEGYVNQLEPAGLIAAFAMYPPDGFDVRIAENGLPLFTTRFDLLTTVDPALRRRLASLPDFLGWRKWLTLETCFIGATPSEYACLPRHQEPAALLEWIETHCSDKQPLTIIKDLPVASPLLSAADNDYSRRLIAAAEKRGFFSVEGQALAVVAIDFATTDEFLARMSRSRRRNLRRKLRSRDELRIEVLPCGDVRLEDSQWRAQLYEFYLSVWRQSEIHFDLLTPEFFDHLLLDEHSSGKLFCYWYEDRLVGFNLCYQYQGRLVDKYIGFDYSLALDFNLYFVSWFVNLDYAIEQGLQEYVAGWTDPEVKASLGASFTYTRHLVRVRNPLLRGTLRYLRHFFEDDKKWSAPPAV